MTFNFLCLKSMQGTGDHNFRCLHNTSLNCKSKLHYFRQDCISVSDLNVDFSGVWNISVSFSWCWRSSSPKLAFCFVLRKQWLSHASTQVGSSPSETLFLCSSTNQEQLLHIPNLNYEAPGTETMPVASDYSVLSQNFTRLTSWTRGSFPILLVACYIWNFPG